MTDATTEQVEDTVEMQRILSLPRRTLPAPDDLATALTRKLARKESPYPGPLYAIQAQALYEAWKYGGLLAPLRVGSGKTLVGFLLPIVMGGLRPLVLAPAALEQDYRREFQRLSRSWHGEAPLFISYERLSTPSSGTRRDSQGVMYQEDLLERLAPDLLIFDEVHRVRNHGAVCTKRVKRYLTAHPTTKVAAMSGSLTRRSVKDFAHIAEWCLRGRSPVPRTYSDLEAWALATDEQDALYERIGIGALSKLLTRAEKKKVEEGHDPVPLARGAIQRRLAETPGVVGTRDGPLAIPLEIRELPPITIDPKVDASFESVRLRWELPSGMPMADGLELARHAKTLGCGYYLDYHPRPLSEWLEARREWAGFSRDTVRYQHYDSEALVKEAVRNGLLCDGGLLARWERVSPSYTPEDHAVVAWISDESVETSASWVERERGIVWTGNIALGVALERALHIPFYGAEGRDRDGRFILDHPPGFPMIASKQANGTGRNLQRGWSSNLFFTTPSEQVIGRTHRVGQEAEKVTCDVFVGCLEHVLAFEKEVGRALYAEQITGDAQRLCYACSTLPTATSVSSRKGYRWER